MVMGSSGLEHGARPQRFPCIGAPLRKENLTDPTRRELAAGIADHADAHDRDVEILPVHLGDAAYGTLRDASLAHYAVDARDHLLAGWAGGARATPDGSRG